MELDGISIGIIGWIVLFGVLIMLRSYLDRSVLSESEQKKFTYRNRDICYWVMDMKSGRKKLKYK